MGQQDSAFAVALPQRSATFPVRAFAARQAVRSCISSKAAVGCRRIAPIVLYAHIAPTLCVETKLLCNSWRDTELPAANPHGHKETSGNGRYRPNAEQVHG